MHPNLPSERPLVIAHRAGNDVATAKAAVALGAVLIETDVWRYHGRLELRHDKTMGPIPLLWDRWKLLPGWTERLVLEDLLEAVPVSARLFLDFKGEDRKLPEHVVSTIQTHQPERQIIVCGRTWTQIDAVVDQPDVTAFYSVNSDEELAAVWAKLDRMRHPAISIHCRYLQPDLVRRLKDVNATIVTWPINTVLDARRLHELGVDGFTSDSLDLIEFIARERGAGLEHAEIPTVVHEGKGAES